MLTSPKGGHLCFSATLLAVHPHLPKKEIPGGWRARVAALKNIPRLLAMVWETSPILSTASVALRLVSSFLPLATLWIGKLIIDLVVRAVAGRPVEPFRIWRLLAMEIGLAVLSEVLSRSTSFVDSLLGDKFTNVVSLKLMDHAAKLDLVSFEDPVFYDKLESGPADRSYGAAIPRGNPVCHARLFLVVPVNS
jgi:ATP-binding cassette, subfamily B, bacterial